MSLGWVQVLWWALAKREVSGLHQYASSSSYDRAPCGWQNGGRHLKAVNVLLYLLTAFAEELSESSDTRCNVEGRQKWLRREWQGYPSQEVEQGEVGRDADSSVVSSTERIKDWKLLLL